MPLSFQCHHVVTPSMCLVEHTFLDGTVAIGKPERHTHKASHCAASNNRVMHRDHSIIACSRHIYMVFFFAHIPFMVNHNATPAERLQQHPPLFYNKLPQSLVLFVKASHGTTSTSLSQHHFVAIGKSERHMRKALHCAASNNRVHAPRSLYYCLFTPHMVFFFAHIQFVVNHTFNVTPAERLQQYSLYNGLCVIVLFLHDLYV